jgi:Phage tail protein
MLTMVTVDNIRSGMLLLPLMDASNGYVVREIQGLDPVKATLVSSKVAGVDGGQFHNSNREPRNILMKLGLEPDYVSNSVASLRSNLYRFLMPKSQITFALYADDALFGSTDAIVETCDNNMFSADPEVDVSLMCYDPDFHAPAPTVIQSNTVNGVTTQTISYPGTSDTGVIFRFTFPASASEVRLYNTRPDRITNVVDVQGSFLANDVLEINTNPLQKGVTVIRAGLEIPSLFYLDRSSTWISLAPGDNLFRAYYSGTPSPFTLEYTAKYGGF